MTDTRKKWLLTGIKRTRRHEIRLLADTAEEAIALAKKSYRFSQITECVEDPPKRLSGGSWYLGEFAANDPFYENAGWNFLNWEEPKPSSALIAGVVERHLSQPLLGP
jgi:hypothetical protein